MSDLKLYPAIDLLEGRCVRLAQGSFEAVTSYRADPLRLAEIYEEAGARYLHVVDLEGARAQVPKQFDLIQKIVKGTAMSVQVGGGIRSLDQVKAYLDAGVGRVVIGSMALKNPLETLKILEAVGSSKITIAFDYRPDGLGRLRPTSQAWSVTEDLTPGAAFLFYAAYPDLDFLCTDISRDGLLTGISRDFYEELNKVSGHANLLASGGIAGIEDIRLARDLGLRGAIIGKALYEGRFTLEEALAC